MVDTSSFILPFFDADTVFFILLFGFLFFQLAYRLSKKDREGKISDIEKLFWFAIFGLLLYGTLAFGTTTSVYNVINSNPKGAIILSFIHAPFYSEFFNLGGIVNLLGTSQNILGYDLINNIIEMLIVTFVLFLGFIYLLKEHILKEEKGSDKIRLRRTT
ncbi:MAG: hypothetical protein M1286_01435 [Candidatus Marsarchaeota archaeon]|nr:hypothetical protein [Candidatus Marsarchaeota archaeon]